MEEDNAQILNEENENNSYIDNKESVDNTDEVKVLSEDFIQNDSVPEQEQVTVVNENETENPETEKAVEEIETASEKKEETTQQPEEDSVTKDAAKDELDDLFDDLDGEDKTEEPKEKETNEAKDKEEADDVEDNDEDSVTKKKSKKESKKKKDKASKKDKKKLKKKEEIESLKSKIFGDSDDEFDNVLDQMDDDNVDKDDEDFEENSKKILEEIVEKKKGKKQKKRKTDETKKKRSKRQKSTGDDESNETTEDRPRDDLDDILDEMDDEKKEGTGLNNSNGVDMSDFDDMIKSLKAGRSSRRKKNDKPDEGLEDSVRDFVAKMDRAAEDDLRANKAQQPALHKIKMLGEVENYLCKKHLQETFISKGVLVTIKKWIDPLPDKSLPNLKVREVILRCLSVMSRIGTDDLKESGIGRAVMLLSKHPQETLQNKKIAKNLIEQWSRPIFGLKDRYREAALDGEILDDPEPSNDNMGSSSAPARNTTRGMSTDLDAPIQKKSTSGNSLKDFATNHARIPDKIALDFKIMPKSNVEAQSLLSKPKRGTSTSADKALAKKKVPVSKKGAVPRAINMSIEGRNMY